MGYGNVAPAPLMFCALAPTAARASTPAAMTFSFTLPPQNGMRRACRTPSTHPYRVCAGIVTERLHGGDNGKKQDKNRVKEVKESVYGGRRRASGRPKAEASARSGQALKKANHPLQGLKGVLEKFLLLPLRE